MTLPPPVDLGAPLPSPVPSAELVNRLAVRRSAPAQGLTAPGPDAAQMAEILTLAARSPDHGKMTPWRFVVMGPQSRAEIADRLRTMAVQKGLPSKAQAVLAKLVASPVCVLVVSTAAPGAKPVWEQELSAGAVCMNLEHAASAFGFASSWITDWYSYDVDALPLFGVTEGEKVAGFIHLGTPAEPLLERDRPDVAALTSTLP
ncbi:nitroreductase [Brevundimonas sp. NIBR11]|uniref:nitroreductase family protein n=1 Tax=Brevundimonas sp. NIBR11 TaxID=3015999 RepID=UPI0022F12AD4|nr:nitroreductase [Brevundimonas sp. NIBR11]WGM30677.1 Putative NAD(P)H nitroreductase YdjA [Brevundimonas sp. NIBR11]